MVIHNLLGSVFGNFRKIIDLIFNLLYNKQLLFKMSMYSKTTKQRKENGHAPNNENVDSLVSIANTAKRLDLSTRSIYRLIDSGDLPQPIGVRRSKKFRMSDINAYIDKITRLARGGCNNG